MTAMTIERAVDNAIVSTEMEGFVITEKHKELIMKLMNKEITLEEALKELNNKRLLIMSYNLNVSNADCYEGTTTLINKLGIKDENELKSSEALITAYKAASLINEPLAHDFGFEDYKELHRVLFEDLYDWAGKPRTKALSKTATVFTAPEKIEELGGLIFARLKKFDYFTKLPQNGFITEIADLYHSLNMLHPFREGNGRTERVFFVQLIRNAGYDIDYSTLNSDLLMIGSIQAASGVMDTLVRFFEENIISR